jgi:hypothetical protein
MYSTEKFKKFLFFDIETCGKYHTLEDLQNSEHDLGEAFKKKSERLAGTKSWTGDPSQDYLQNVALFPEFGRIACLSYGVWRDDGIVVSSICEQDEREMMKKASVLFHKASNTGMIPTGWNIKNFDIAWMYRKFMMHGMQVPDCLSSYDKKPWEMNTFDLKEFWRSGSSLDVNFEEACVAMGVPNPKDDISGKDVHETFWNGKLDQVKNYCEKDVKSMILLCEKIHAIHHPSQILSNA